ncbi:MAG: AAA family ATPase [Nocardioides sp.]
MTTWLPQRTCTSGKVRLVRRSRIHVTGASGAGTTTLARALADAWAVPHGDADDYFWLPTDPPYVDKRPEADRIVLMEQVFLARGAWVLSGSMLGWGDSVVAQCDAVVFLTLDPAERLRRIEARERVRREGGGPADEEALSAFLTWARGYDDPCFEGRSRKSHEKWLAAPDVRSCDSTAPTRVRCCATRYWPGSPSRRDRLDPAAMTRPARLHGRAYKLS